MPNDFALASTAAFRSHVVLGGHDVLDAGKGEVHVRSSGARNNKDFPILGAPRNQCVQGRGIGWRHQNIGCASVNNGTLARETCSFRINPGVIGSKFPALGIGDLGIGQLAGKPGRVHAPKSDLPILGPIRAPAKMNADNVFGQITLLVEYLHHCRRA